MGSGSDARIPQSGAFGKAEPSWRAPPEPKVGGDRPKPLLRQGIWSNCLAWRSAAVDAVDPAARKVGERGEVLLGGEATRLDAADLAWRRRTGNCGPAAADPTHGRIMSKPLGVVHVLVAGEPTEHRLSKHADESVAAVFAGAGVGQSLACHLRQSERVVEFSIGEHASVGGGDRATKLKHQAPVEIEPESLTIRFTRRVRHGRLAQ